MRIVRDSPFNYEIPVIPLDQHGICNKGLALEMKRRYPHAAAVYKKICIEKMFAAGDLYAHEDKDGFGKIHQMIWVSVGEGTLNEVERAFEKWQRVFFPEQYEAYYDELDPVMLGLVLEAIREYSGITRSDAADLLQVNRKTVHLIENGQKITFLGLYL